MKLSISKLQQIIKEEFEKLNDAQYIPGKGADFAPTKDRKDDKHFRGWEDQRAREAAERNAALQATINQHIIKKITDPKVQNAAIKKSQEIVNAEVKHPGEMGSQRVAHTAKDIAERAIQLVS